MPRAAILRGILTACCIALLPVCLKKANAYAGWKPVSQSELALSAAELGDPDAEAAILFREGELDDSYSDGTNLKIYIRIKIFTNRGRRWADVQLPFRVGQGRITDVHARTVRPDGVAVEVDDRDIFDKVVMKTGHGVWRAKVFTLPAVEAGCIVEYRYRQIFPDGFRYFALDLQSELLTRELVYRIRPPINSKSDLRWVAFNAPDPARFMPKWEGVYFIRANDIPPFRREPLMPPDRAVKIWGWLYYSDDFLIEPDKYWRDYAARAYSRSEPESKPTRTIRRVVETITLSNDTPAARIARIYDYVQNEIRNIGCRDNDAEPGLEAEIKRNASVDETLRRRYGSPSEITRLFVAMLRATGLDARVAELTTRDEAVFHRSFADSFQFNSDVAAVLHSDGRIQFFDPGTPFCPPGMLAWEKEAVTALIHGRSDNPLVETPLSEPSLSARSRTLKLQVAEDGGATVTAETRLSGQHAIELRAKLGDLSAEEQGRVASAHEREGSPGIVIKDSSLTLNQDRKGYGVSIGYTFAASETASRTEKRLLIRPGMLAFRDEGLAPLSRRANNLFFRYPWVEQDRIEIRTPPGFSVERLPDAIEFDMGAGKYHSTYRRIGERLFFERTLTISGIFLTPEQYPTARSFFDRVHQADRSAIALRQN
jgi:transglutaminase-like putative cysteine protease